MSAENRKDHFDRSGLVSAPGDVFHWWSPIAKKGKFHLCVTWDYDFVFLNTPKDTRRWYDLDVAAEHLHFVKPTRTRFSAIGCKSIIDVCDTANFRKLLPDHKGTLNHTKLLDVLAHICDLEHIERRPYNRLREAERTLREFG